MGFVVLMLIFMSVSTSNTASVTTANTLLQSIDEKFKRLETKIETDFKALKTAHGGCAPCSKIPEIDEFCDCSEFKPKRDCLDFYQAGRIVNGLYRLHSPTFNPRYVYCDQTTRGGGWTVIQRRKDGSENFFRNWNDYKIGFGKLKGEFWFGNDNINKLAGNYANNSLLIHMRFPNYPPLVWAMYSKFSVGNESTKYIMHVSRFSSNNIFLDDKLSHHNNMMFSTHDQDNDNRNTTHCAKKFKGGWWFNNCFRSHLNGMYGFGPGMYINWGTGKFPLQAEFTEMKVRRNI